MDEPLGALDAEFREHMAQELRALHDRMHATTVYVTHDQLEAMQMGDKIVVMNHGVVEQFGRPQEIYDWPATTFVAKFIGSPAMNLLPFDGMVGNGATSIMLAGTEVQIPTMISGDDGALIFGSTARTCPSRRRRGLSRAHHGGGISRHHADRHAGYAAWAGQGPRRFGQGGNRWRCRRA